MSIKSSMEINFNQLELNLLCNALMNESDRWDDYCLSPNTTYNAKCNYQADMIYLDKLVSNAKYALGSDEAKLLLNSVAIGIIIEALDNEIEMQPPILTSENIQFLKNLRERIKNDALSELGDRFLKIAHYDRNIKQ